VRVSIGDALAALGRRVSVRRVVGSRDGRPLFSDAIGVLERADDDVVLRLPDGGEVAFPRAAVVAARVVPVRGSLLTGLELEAIAAEGWRGLESTQLGGWLLRAGGGFSGRANSVLPLGDPGLPFEDAVSTVVDWYAARGLPARFQVPLPDAEATDRLLAEHGWAAYDEVRVMIADLPALLDAAATDPEPALAVDRTVRVDERPDEAWLGAYHYRGGALPPNARAVIENGDHLGFASVRTTGDPSRVLAIARGSVERRWLGVTAVEVAPQARRQGLAGQVLLALARWATGLGAHSCFLQVAVENTAALALYGRAGFVEHHRYRYRLAPTPPSVPGDQAGSTR
jgi:ribosomal protein S18 acetylase RimI-like enzyme